MRIASHKRFAPFREINSAGDGQPTDVYSLASQEGDTECRFRVQAKTAK
jgi:hypothetical protein